MGNSFNKSFDESFKTGMVIGADSALEATKEKNKREELKLQEAVARQEELSIAEKIVASSGRQDLVDKFEVLKSEVKTPDGAKAVREFFQEQAKNQREVGEKIALERYKGMVDGSNKVLDRMAEQGGFTPQSLQDYKSLAEQEARQASGLDGVESRINSNTQTIGNESNNFNDVMNKPMKSKADLEGEAAMSKKLNERNLNRAELSKELNDFFLVDDQIKRTDEGFVGRIMQGVGSTAAGLDQSTAEGFSIATHDALKKRLRVRLVRAAGDVGNINIVEQTAAEQIIPGKWDSKGTAKLKRAFLKKASEALSSKEGPELESEIKTILNDFAKTKAFEGPQGKEADKVTGGTIKEGQTATNKKTGEVMIYKGGKWQKKKK